MDSLLDFQISILTPLAEFVAQNYYLGVMIFILLNAATVVGLIPGWILMLLAGYLFGMVNGVLYVFVGTSAGCCFAFYMGRRFFQKKILARYGHRISILNRAIDSYGFRIVLLTRLSPIFPYNLQNYGYGITNLSFRSYLLGCIGMIPSISFQVYFGSLMETVHSIRSGVTNVPDETTVVMHSLAVFFTLLALGYFSVIARREYRRFKYETHGEGK